MFPYVESPQHHNHCLMIGNTQLVSEPVLRIKAYTLRYKTNFV